MTDQGQLEGRGEDHGPPTSVMQSYREMSRADRLRLQTGGAAMVLVGVAFPFVAVLFVTLPVMFWILDFFVLFVGILFVWPPAGIWATERIPAAVAGLIPSARIARALGKIPDRRSLERGTSADRMDGGST